MAKRKITVTQELEIDFEFPLYVKVNDYTFCFFKDYNDGIMVGAYPFNYGIEWSINLPKVWIACDQITKEEFELEFKKVQEKINQLI